MCLHRAGAPLPFFICSDGHAQDRCRDEAGVPAGAAYREALRHHGQGARGEHRLLGGRDREEGHHVEGGAAEDQGG